MDVEARIILDRFTPRPYQLPIITAIEKKNFKRAILIWPRRAGKDVVALNLMLRAAIRKVIICYYIFPTFAQARKVLWKSLTSEGQRFLDFIPPQLVDKIHSQDMRIELKNGSIIQLLGSDNYDCFDDQTEILTDDGWRLFKDLQKNERVAVLNDGYLEYETPLQHVEYDYEGPMYKLTNSSIDFLVTPNHRFYVRSEKGFYKFKRADDPTIAGYAIPSKSKWKGEDRELFIFPVVLSQWMCGKGRKVNKIYNRTMPMKDFVALLGIFLAEGCTFSDHKTYRVSISQTKANIRADIESLLKRLDINYQSRFDQFTFEDRQLYEYFSQFGKQKDRFIPANIKNLSREYLSILFEWLLKGDGHVCDTYTGYWSISKRLIDDVQELILKLGLSGNVSIRKQNASNIKGRVIVHKNTLYEIRVRTSDFKWLSTPKDSITTEHYQGKVYCVSTNAGIIKVRRNGKEYWSGNSLVGTNPSFIIYSEAALQDPNAHRYLSPALKYNNGVAIFITTPRGHNWVYDLWQIAQQNPDVWYSQLLTIEETGHISMEDIEEEIKSGEISRDHAQQEYFCSFDKGQEGSYYSKYIDKMRLDQRIGKIDYDSAFKTYISFDIGNDCTSLIWFQVIGKSVHCIDYYENSGSGFGLEHYAKVALSKDYAYAKSFCVFPHDMAVTEWGGVRQTRLEKAKQLGLDGFICDKKEIDDGIEAVRSLLARVYIDEVKCKPLIKALSNYRQEYDPKRNVYKGIPLHDWSSHAADSFRYLALSIPRLSSQTTPEQLEKRYEEAMGRSRGSYNMPSIFREDLPPY